MDGQVAERGRRGVRTLPGPDARRLRFGLSLLSGDGERGGTSGGGADGYFPAWAEVESGEVMGRAEGDF